MAGHSNGQIARDLAISEQAVKEHVSALLRTFGASNRASLVRAALSLRLTGSSTFDQAWLPSLFVDAPLHIAILVGPDHVVHATSRMLRDVVGADAVGRPGREVLTPLLGRVVLDLADRAYRTGERIVADELALEPQPGRAPAGERVRVLASPLRGRDGAVDGVFLLFCTSDDLAEDREALHLAIEERSTILRRTDLAVVVVDQEGRPLVANGAARARLPRAIDPTRPLIGQVIEHWRFADPAGAALPEDALPLARALRGETVEAVPVVAQADGDERSVVLYVSAAPLVDAEGRQRGAIAIVDDRTIAGSHPALLELAERAVEALRRLREVSANTKIAFDQTPIATVVATLARGLVRADAAAVFLASERTGTLRLLSDDNLRTRPRVIEVPFGSGAAGVAYVTHRPVRVEDYPAWAHRLPDLDGVVQSAMAVPLSVGGRPIGVLAVHTITRRVFTDEEEWSLVRLADETGPLLAGGDPS